MTKLRLGISILVVGLLLTAGGGVNAKGKSNPAVDVNPSTGLSNGQTIEVSGTGFHYSLHQQDVRIVECGGGDLKSHPYHGPVCTYSTYHVDVQSDVDGNFGPVAFRVASSITGTRYEKGVGHAVTATHDCQPANDCYVRAYTTSGPYHYATTPLTFGP